jgi:hypothetical protein
MLVRSPLLVGWVDARVTQPFLYSQSYLFRLF